MSGSFPMNGGDGIYSYTKNSEYQREASNNVKEMIDMTIVEKLDVKHLTFASRSIHLADLGCSVGPNTFIAMQNVMAAMEKKYYAQSLPSEDLEFQVFFNDHISNDFNTLFASLPVDRKYFGVGVPGSFYDRLFPSSSLHFVHSSYALHWLSKVPEKLLDKNSSTWNKGKIHYTGASDEVMKAYAAQFESDMENFLDARAKEIVVGGMMVLIMQSLPDNIDHSKTPTGVIFKFVEDGLMDMVNAGIISEPQVDMFNLPVYSASAKEMTRLIESNGCFSIEKMELIDPRSKDAPINAQAVIMHVRAAMEGVIVKHFGRDIVDDLFEHISQKCMEDFHLMESSNMKGTQLFIVLKRK
ncbi:LAMT/FAMT [Ilex paraguariensis]|uniref:LAMT/FAMT protein n=1 Tax=Ilex paraguariensis TaxID=185542 RepID=A0ABC8QXH4_9AQUA